MAHEYGLGQHYTAELTFIDRVVDYLLSRLPREAVLVVTADHGQVDVDRNVLQLSSEVLAHVSMQSGEGRFRWLHARAGRARALYEAAQAGRYRLLELRERVAVRGQHGSQSIPLPPVRMAYGLSVVTRLSENERYYFVFNSLPQEQVCRLNRPLEADYGTGEVSERLLRLPAKGFQILHEPASAVGQSN